MMENTTRFFNQSFKSHQKKTFLAKTCCTSFKSHFFDGKKLKSFYFSVQAKEKKYPPQPFPIFQATSAHPTSIDFFFLSFFFPIFFSFLYFSIFLFLLKCQNLFALWSEKNWSHIQSTLHRLKLFIFLLELSLLQFKYNWKNTFWPTIGKS